jgi:cyclophilin family peptidyl-prolyl cis-trans isomerase
MVEVPRTSRHFLWHPQTEGYSVQRMTYRSLLAAVLALAAVSACDSGDKAPPPDAAPPPQAPATAGKFRVQFETSAGNFVVDVDPALSPLGAARFRTLVDSGYFNDVRFFRVVPGFVVQFGMHGDSATNERWRAQPIMDEPVRTSNTRGTIVFAKPSMPNARSNQFFINLADNSMLDPQGFSPFGHVSEGMDVVDKIYSGYGGAPSDRQPEIASGGNAFLKREYPKLDYIKSASIIP